MDLTLREALIYVCRLLGSLLVAFTVFELSGLLSENIETIYSPQLKMIVAIGLLTIGCWMDSRAWRRGIFESLFLATMAFAALVGLRSLGQIFSSLNSETGLMPSFTWHFLAPYVLGTISWGYFFGAGKIKEMVEKCST